MSDSMSPFQGAASPKFTILVQLVPCANQKFDTCLKTVKIILNNDRNNVSEDQNAKTGVTARLMMS